MVLVTAICAIAGTEQVKDAGMTYINGNTGNTCGDQYSAYSDNIHQYKPQTSKQVGLAVTGATKYYQVELNQHYHLIDNTQEYGFGHVSKQKDLCW